jgi:hypothetical protein
MIFVNKIFILKIMDKCKVRYLNLNIRITNFNLSLYLIVEII